MTFKFFVSVLAILVLAACNSNDNATTNYSASDSILVAGQYGYDAAFLKKHNRNVIELQSDDGRSKVLVSADYQGRVMTSSTNGDSGTSFGWINYALIESGKFKKQFNPVGGEERFWLGPEGGQYALYFKKGDSFSISHWQVPALIDTVSYDYTFSGGKKQVSFTKKATLTNHSGNEFSFTINRSITLLDRQSIQQKLQLSIPDSIRIVGYESDNSIRNTGTESWSQTKGLLSIWLLGMFNPSLETFVIIPFQPVPGAKKYITDNYFGKIPDERLRINDSLLFFTCDGKLRSKIGLSPLIAKNLAGSFDFSKNVLTIISFPVQREGLYVNSKWEQQQFPFKGDVVNAYNDGPLPDGTQLGSFYELESSSQALELTPGSQLNHRQTTCHFEGSYNQLRSLAKQLLGVDLNDIRPSGK